MPEVFVGVGSNVEPEQHIRAGLDALSKCFGTVAVSSIYRNSPLGFEGDDFLNLVVGFTTTLDAETLVSELQQTERECGRTEDEQSFGPRTLDLDLLLYGDDIIERPGLRLPREEVVEYAFVLKPLSEIAPDRVHPELGKTFKTLWEEFGEPGTDLVPVVLGSESNF